MTNKDFILELAEQTGYSPEDTQKMVNVIVETMGDNFQEDNVVLAELQAKCELEGTR